MCPLLTAHTVVSGKSHIAVKFMATLNFIENSSHACEKQIIMIQNLKEY